MALLYLNGLLYLMVLLYLDRFISLGLFPVLYASTPRQIPINCVDMAMNYELN